MEIRENEEEESLELYRRDQKMEIFEFQAQVVRCTLLGKWSSVHSCVSSQSFRFVFNQNSLHSQAKVFLHIRF